MDVKLIANPVSGGGRGALSIEPVMAALRQRFGEVALFCSSGPGDARRLAREQADAGAGLIVALGGDGTVSECADGIQLSGRGTTPMAFVPAGTGSDFARGFADSNLIDEWTGRIGLPAGRAIDLGALTIEDGSGQPILRHFNNICSLGVSGHIAARVNAARSLRFLPGKALFFLHSVIGLLTFRPVRVRLDLEGQAPVELAVTLIVCANGRYFGGGMKVAPMAELDDGLLDLIIFPALSRPKLIWEFLGIYSGRHMKNPLVRHHRVRRFSAHALPDNPPLAVEVDGEAVGARSINVEVKPGALSLAL